MNVGDRARQRAAVGQPQVDVQGRRSPGPAVGSRRLRQRGDDRRHSVEHRGGEHRRRQRAARQLGPYAVLELGPGEQSVEEPLPDTPQLETPELDGEAILYLVERFAHADAEARAQERAAGVLDKPDDVPEIDQLTVAGGQRSAEERRRVVPRRAERSRTAERDGVEAPPRIGDQLAGAEVARVERLQRMTREDLIARGRRVRTGSGPHGPIDDIKQLGDRHRRGTLEVRPLIVARVRDDQPLRRGKQGVEQHLAILGAGITIADVRILEQQVIAVAGCLAGKFSVVEPEDADNPVGHRAHRHERAHREVPGAEVRAGRASPEAIGEERPDVGELELGRLAVVGMRVAANIVKDPPELGPLPGLALGGRGQRVRGSGDRADPHL